MGHADAVRVLISLNADVNKKEPCHGKSALYTSAIAGHVPVLQLLISKGAKTDVKDSSPYGCIQGTIGRSHLPS